MQFEHFIEGYLIIGAGIQTTRVASKSLCSSRCFITPVCKSFNLCDKKFCRLNSVGVHEIDTSDVTVWSANPSCIYLGMTSETSPKCIQLGTLVDIRNDDLNPNICKFNLKRVDCQGMWVEKVIDTASEWKRYSERYVTDSYYGGKSDCETYRVHEWFKWINELKIFTDARLHCTNIGGQLFGDINGTTQQYDFLAKNQNYENFWLGITDEATSDVYLSLNGNDVTHHLIWAPPGELVSEPSRNWDELYICMCINWHPISPGSHEYFHDAPDYYQFRFPCDMILKN